MSVDNLRALKVGDRVAHVEDLHNAFGGVVESVWTDGRSSVVWSGETEMGADGKPIAREYDRSELIAEDDPDAYIGEGAP